MKTVLIFFIIFPLAYAIFAPGISLDGGGGGGGGFGGRSSSSSSSEEHSHRPRPHRPRPHRPRPHRPRPPRPNDPEPECERGWMSFDRSAGLWCVKVFYGVVTKYTADSLCENEGAVLTGLQNANERIQIANAGRSLSAQNGGGLAEIWLGSVRRAQCPTKPSCAPYDTFEWTDGQTTGTEGMYWPGNEPNNYATALGGQDCLELHVSVADGVAGRFGYPHASLDDQQCADTTVRMYACGKLAN